MTLLYRLLTGPDDASFCHKVSHALAQGWELYGSPTMAIREGTVVCGQAVVKQSDAAYREDTPLSEQ